MKKPWPETKKRRILSLLGTMPVKEVAKQADIDLSTLLSACSRYGWSYAFNHNRPEPVTSIQSTFLRRNAGRLSVSDMAAQLNIPAQRIRGWAAYNGISLRLTSGRSVHSSIPDEDVELMRQLHDEGLSCRQIAMKFDISHVYCWQLCNYMNRVDV